MLSNILAGFIIILVGATLLPIVANQIQATQGYYNASGTWFSTGNISGASATIVNLITLFFALAVMGAAVAVTISGLKEAGLM